MTLVRIQFITDRPSDYEQFDSAFWSQVPNRPVNALCIQGVVFTGYDHYTVVPLPSGGCRAICWKDDAHDYLPGLYQARIINFPLYGPEKWRRGAINPRQTSEVYAGAELIKYYRALGDKAPVTRRVYEYSQFIIPAGANTLHGKWVTDSMFDALQTSRIELGWRGWGEKGDGKGSPVPDQRPLGRFKEPLGTLTFFMRNTAAASGVHVATNELQLNQTVGGDELVSENVGAGVDELTHMWTSVAGEPGVAWPTDVNGTLDASTIGADVDFGFLTLGGSAGHIARVNTGLTADVDSKPQTEALFEGTGIKTFTVGGSWGAGDDANDRLEALLAGLRPTDHGNQALEIRHGSDSFVTGAWSAGLSLVRVIDEAENVNEANIRSRILVRIRDEIENIVEGVVKTKLVVKAINEIQNIVEDIQKVIGIIRIIDEMEDVNEEVNKTKLIAKAVDEVENVVEDIVRSRILVRVRDEIENIVESLVNPRVLVRIRDEVENINEVVVKTKLIVKAIDEVEDVAEAVFKVLGKVQVVDETVNVVEAVNKTKLIVQIVDETEDVVEGLVRSMTLVRVVDEGENVVEAKVISRILVRIVSEVEDVVEGISKTRGRRFVIDETVDIVEAVNKVLGKVQVIDETVDVVEAISKTKLIAKSVAETEEVNELIVKALAINRAINEREDVQESEVVVRSLNRMINEIEDVVESVVRVRGIVRIVNETVDVAESVVKLVFGVIVGFLKGTVNVVASLLGEPAADPSLKGSTKIEEDDQ